MVAPIARSWQRPALFVAGCLLLPLGIAGVFLPLVPGTLLLIVAAACFARSSPPLERWILAHPRLGPGVAAWRESGAISRSAKAAALIGMTVSLVLVWISEAPPITLALSTLVMVLAALYVASRPSPPPVIRR